LVVRHLVTSPLTAGGRRLDSFLATELKDHGLSRARLQALIAEGHVTLDGRRGKASAKLVGGEQIVVEVPEAVALDVAPEPMSLDVLFEDGDIVVVNKPAGLSVHPGAGRTGGTLVSGLLAHCKDLSGIGGVLRPGIVHRLDAGTSGVLVVAKNDKAHEALATQFKERTIEKRYLAFVLGTPSPKERTLRTMYGRHPTRRQRFSSKVTRGKQAVTSYRVTHTGGGLSELDVLLGTGRTHQIRVHLADVGHPIVGDATYGGRALARIKDPELLGLCQALGHQALHAVRLSLRHPKTGESLTFVATPPPELRALAARLRQVAGTT
jgi:23S rRNA pseudouridine1911/1915/1917 synthase